jgi:hypothetical protein
MAWSIALILFGNWVLGLWSGAQLGQWVHLLLLGACISFVMGLIDVAARSRGSPRRKPPRR